MLILNITLIIIMVFDIDLNPKKGFNFVSATLGVGCDNDVSRTEDFCEKGPFVAGSIGTRSEYEEELAECCPYPVDDPQEYCLEKDGSFQCLSSRPCWTEGEEEDCPFEYPGTPPYTPEKVPAGTYYKTTICKGSCWGGLESLSCRGKFVKGEGTEGECWKGFGPFVINKESPPPMTSVFSEQKLSWILTEKGELTPAKVVISIW